MTREALVLVFLMFVGSVALAVGQMKDEQAPQQVASVPHK